MEPLGDGPTWSSGLTIAPVVIRSARFPFLSLAAAVITVYFFVKAPLMVGGAVEFSFFMGVLALLVAVFAFYRASKTSVVIDRNQFTVNRGRKSTTYDASKIESIDLSNMGDQIVFSDGTGVRLPLEGSKLVEAALLLSPSSVD